MPFLSIIAITVKEKEYQVKYFSCPQYEARSNTFFPTAERKRKRKEALITSLSELCFEVG